MIRSRAASFVRTLSTPCRAGPSTPRLHHRLARSSSTQARRNPGTSKRSAPLAALAREPEPTIPYPPPSQYYPIHSGSPTSADDELLKAHFDDPHYVPITSSAPVGLFQFPPLTAPQALGPLTERALVLCMALQKRIVNAPSEPSGKELRLVIKNFDRLSDTLCGVIDLCEKVRHLHPDPAWVEAADEASDRLNGYMNVLNADEGMYKVSSSRYITI